MDSISTRAIVNGDTSENPNGSRVCQTKMQHEARLEFFLKDDGPNTILPFVTTSPTKSKAEHEAKTNRNIEEIMVQMGQ
ncbi:hypothetical protein CLIM01_02093 [Colletotrichum limetticola]|uniref:Uncharacterized protein n=1 Tax=Colletotrichum limetticola TaxID=1209924 RepID=A0ABQ9Q9T7_9PEZI|nr:hypothetical protein CLIM01_02093 [Colletotrichum limetticola]